jgi:drug/metabolite transporter (DMT)-like permease
MNQALAIAVGTGLGAMIGWGLADFFAKKTIDQIGDITTLAWAHVCGIVVLGSIVFGWSLGAGHQLTLPNDTQTWVLLAFFGVLQGIVYLLVYRGFGKGQLSILNPIFASYSGVAALVLALVFGEAVGAAQGLFLAVIFAGILLISFEKKNFNWRRLHLSTAPGFPEIAGAMVLAAFWTVAWDRFIMGKDWLVYALIMYAWMTVGIVIIARLQRVNLTVKHNSAWKFLVLIGVSEVAAYIALSYGFSLPSHASVVALLSGAFSVPTVILARIFLKETMTRLQVAGAVMIVAGIMLVAVA